MELRASYTWGITIAGNKPQIVNYDGMPAF